MASMIMPMMMKSAVESRKPQVREAHLDLTSLAGMGRQLFHFNRTVGTAVPGIVAGIFSHPLPQAPVDIIVSLMQPKQRSRLRGVIAGILPVAGLIAMLLALAVLQLRWSERVSDAERSRLQQNLQRSYTGFQAAMARDLLRLCQALQAAQPREFPVLVDHLFDRYIVWQRIARHPGLINGLYLWQIPSTGPSTLLKLDPQEHKVEPVEWPESLHEFSVRSAKAKHRYGLPRLPARWVWDERIPALIHPIYISMKTPSNGRPQFYGYLLVVFNPVDFAQVYIPDLGQRFFPLSSGFDFQLIERTGDHQHKVVYSSGPHVSSEIFTHPDAIVPLLPAPFLEGPMRYPAINSSPSTMNAGTLAHPVFLSAISTQKWQIAVRHRSGSVDAAVTSLRRRDLAVSIVVLVMLLVSLITILAATRRARRLARLQMEFASGVSHELRTPLAVISSAAENLADGIITDGNQIRDYGALIHRESLRLSGMVDNILDFAQLESYPHNEPIEPVFALDVLNAVVANERSLIEAAGVSVEVRVPSDIPLLLTNPAVLQQCLQNLLNNALKYGSNGGRIVLTASAARENGDARVLIRVEDFGAGIALEELPHIFEPFYRTEDVRDSQIPGTGLGLSLTRKMMEVLGGRITVESLRGKGSAFTLHVPAKTTEARRA